LRQNRTGAGHTQTGQQGEAGVQFQARVDLAEAGHGDFLCVVCGRGSCYGKERTAPNFAADQKSGWQEKSRFICENVAKIGIYGKFFKQLPFVYCLVERLWHN
jgi:hypothetical protein